MNKRFYIFLLVFTLLLSTTCFAAEGDGNGTGNGANSNIALTLVSSNPGDNSTDVSRRVIFQLDFNKNVCNLKVLENNSKCFHLVSEDGNPVKIKLIFPDDQVQRTYKRQVFVQPVEKLKANASYRLSVDSTLMAKNGNSIDNAHIVEFTTGKRTKAAQPSTLKKLGFATQEFVNAYPETDASVPKSQEELLDGAPEKSMDSHTLAVIVAVAIIIIIAAFTVINLRKKKKQ